MTFGSLPGMTRKIPDQARDDAKDIARDDAKDIARHDEKDIAQDDVESDMTLICLRG